MGNWTGESGPPPRTSRSLSPGAAAQALATRAGSIPAAPPLRRSPSAASCVRSDPAGQAPITAPAAPARRAKQLRRSQYLPPFSAREAAKSPVAATHQLAATHGRQFLFLLCESLGVGTERPTGIASSALPFCPALGKSGGTSWAEETPAPPI
jgi:hypothetical protein